ncbi:MAG: peroxide stress protein YaaA [Actinomycetaceae bacterium]|nr:peroxide stress protein YaaA [Actinomycetaceae bacterium]
MIVLLPPSEGKTAPTEGSPIDLSRIEPFGSELFQARTRVIESLIEVSQRDEALDILGVGQRVFPEVVANRELWEAPTDAAFNVYSGVLFEAGKIADRGLSYQASESLQVLVQSALFGLVDLSSRIPRYRVSMGVKLPQLGSLAQYWKPHLDSLMTMMSTRQLVVDCRSGAYIKAWPGLDGDHDLLRITALRDRNGKRTVVSHAAKKYRGILAGALMDHAPELLESFDCVIGIARGLVGQNGVVDVEIRERRGFLELALVTE